MLIYDRFMIIKTIPRHERIHCPSSDCDNIMIRNDKHIQNHISKIRRQFYYLCNKSNNNTNTSINKDKNIAYKGHFVSKNDKKIKKCSNDLCKHEFGMIFGYWKRHCYAWYVN